MNNDTTPLTDDEWRAFQAIPDQGYSHRGWVDRKIAQRVRKAQADALRDAADSVRDNAASPYCLPCHRDDADLLRTIAATIEQED